MVKNGLTLRAMMEAHGTGGGKLKIGSSLGDPYLCQNSGVFRAIRKACLDTGTAYKPEKFGLFSSLPLLSLENQLRSKTIPFHRNAHLASMIARRLPADSTAEALTDLGLQRNFLLHESAHSVYFHSQFKNFPQYRRTLRTRSTLMTIIAGEAFANTCESLMSLDLQGPEGNFFMNMSSYLVSSPRNRRDMIELAQRFSRETLSRTLFALFLHSNMLYRRLGDRDCQRILRLASAGAVGRVRPGDLRCVKKLAVMALSLNDRFRLVTTQAYLRFIGIPGTVSNLLDFDPLEYLDSHPQLWGPFRIVNTN